ncbi:hypothetical protein Tco_0850407 [Tanacetum coccineum]
MSTQQDICAAGSENRPPMLNKDNYVPWLSRLLRYAKSRPNGKLIYNSIMNGPYVRLIISEPGDLARTVPVPETFHEQTDDELTEAEIKQMEADDQAIQTILLGLPEDIYAVVDRCNGGNQFRQYVGQNIRNQHRYNAVQNVGNQNPNGNGNVVAARAEGNAIGNNGNQIRCYNYRGLGHLARNCTVRPRRRDAAYLQTQLLNAQKEEAGIQLQAKEFCTCEVWERTYRLKIDRVMVIRNHIDWDLVDVKAYKSVLLCRITKEVGHNNLADRDTIFCFRSSQLT